MGYSSGMMNKRVKVAKRATTQDGTFGGSNIQYSDRFNNKED